LINEFGYEPNVWNLKTVNEEVLGSGNSLSIGRRREGSGGRAFSWNHMAVYHPWIEAG
jgi:hypothetical protein